METVRDILDAHHSGISKPGLLAWARLRIDTAMTEAQLDEELAALGDEVVDVDGFLYLRRNLELARRDRAPRQAEAPMAGAVRVAPATVAPASVPTSAPVAPPGSAPTTARGRAVPGRSGFRLPGLRLLTWLGFLLIWIVGFTGIPFGSNEATPVPTIATSAPTPLVGTVIDVHDMTAGDCIVLPWEDTFSEIRRVPCDTPHGGEVIFVGNHPDGDFPGDDGFRTFVDERCPPAFAAWTGSGVDAQELLEIGWFTPTEDGWKDGGRSVECYLTLADGSLAERSYRSANP